jgi:hypothetical protein
MAIKYTKADSRRYQQYGENFAKIIFSPLLVVRFIIFLPFYAIYGVFLILIQGYKTIDKLERGSRGR